MDIKEKAKAYAEGKAQDAITTAIEEAYAAGYKDGYNDGMLIKNAPDVVEDKLEFIDLHLPDGILWASDYLRGKDGKLIYCTYDEAEPLGIPTDGQFQDLMKRCKVSLITPEEGNEDEKIYKIGVLDKHICLSNEKGFWVKDYFRPSNDTDKYRACVESMKLTKCDKNTKLPVIIVKKRKKI